jgi:Ser/Thr protein kinase RdoA (MazF antagonist)
VYDPPRWASLEAGLVATGWTLPARESTSWLVRHQNGLAILRRLDQQPFPPASQVTRDDLTWLHGYLNRLTATGFPAPRPIAAFDGQSWVCRDGAAWELMSYLPGRAVGWDSSPGMRDIGQMLARYHQAAVTLPRPPQRPVSYPLDELPTRLAGPDVRDELGALDVDLDKIDHANVERHVIHGDFTAHNVLAIGQPPALSAVVDFALAYVDPLWADIGFGLWRSGRPQQDAVGLDLDRVGDFVAGYSRLSPLPQQAARAIPIYIRARGLQQVVKGHDRGQPPTQQLLARIRWLTDHRADLEERIAAAISGP